MPESRLEYLFNCYVHHTNTSQEEEELMALLMQPGNERDVQILIDKVIENTGSEMQMPDLVAASILQNILQKDKASVVPFKNKKTGFVLWMRVAAAVILFMAGAAYWIFNKKDVAKTNVATVAPKHSPVLPAGDKTVLTMADGSIIILDSVQNGPLQHGHTRINKQSGLLIYTTPVSPDPNAPVVYNTLSIPRGGQYEVILPDGSKVWLNAESALHFPTAFKGNQREVVLTGEAYFEVAKNKEKPFQVKVGDMSIKVLGTHFNVNASADENSIKTSLLEGSVKIIKGNKSDLLKPGQQAILNKKENILKIANADMNEVMAWKNGLFQFEGSDITTIMRQIGRWYDMEVIYAGKIPVRRFQGKISRRAQLSEVLEILKLSNVKFSVVGKKIIVE